MTEKNIFLIQKGAMFGLDARIALVIFGTLSLISSAALYSAIKDAEATALLSDLKEIGKAWEQHFLDTSSNIKTNTNNSFRYDIEELIVDNGKKNWSGPYLSYETSSDPFYVLHTEYKNIQLVKLTTNETWGGTTYWTDGDCGAGDPCAVWSYINGIDSQKVVELVDKKVDGIVGADSGRLRWTEDRDDGFYLRIFYNIAPL